MTLSCKLFLYDLSTTLQFVLLSQIVWKTTSYRISQPVVSLRLAPVEIGSTIVPIPVTKLIEFELVAIKTKVFLVYTNVENVSYFS